MCVSIEALAMAGVDCDERGMDIKEWKLKDSEPPPPHLFADHYNIDEDDGDYHTNFAHQIQKMLRFINMAVKAILGVLVTATMEIRKRFMA